jgi:hypothetical protein
LSQGSDVLDKTKGQMRLSERLEAVIPGFRGYKEKELRRESDRLIRNVLHRRLSQANSNLREAYQQISDHRLLDVMSSMDRLVAKFDRITEKINHASYGYTGFFDVVKVQEASLDRMIGFDNQLLDVVLKISIEVDSLKSEVLKQEFETVKDHIHSLTDSVDAFDNTLDQREEVVLGVT